MQPKHLRPGGFGERISPGCEEGYLWGAVGRKAGTVEKWGSEWRGTPCELERARGAPKRSELCGVAQHKRRLGPQSVRSQRVQRHVPA